MENVEILSSQGKNLAAVIYTPANNTGHLAILCPGYLDSKDYNHLVLLAEDLAKNGYTVVRFDPTGTWQSQGEISDYTTSQYLDDIQSVVEYMLKRNSYSYILLGGHSRGGQVSLLYAAKDPRISKVLAIMPSLGRSEIWKKRDEWKKIGYNISSRDIPGTKETREYKVPFSHVLDRDKYDVVAEIKKVTVPTIFFAGELDDVVLPEQVKLIFNQANEPKKFILLEGIDHDYRHKINEIKKVNKIILENL